MKRLALTHPRLSAAAAGLATALWTLLETAPRMF